ncbi:ABC transporter permease [Fibrisoma montanum]|uniref:ABC transporter permease n=1 Tax=Fibrisoma montanum TaxID=2305895 RepID=A0A418M629_9BACT|nr:permease prefix domain 2-containing transporter [Fibrisoma montanum]RIV21322.1 ABC transporter permease [Fibrisoma montanum]
MSAAPPPLAQRLLRWFCAPHRLDELEGDLDELFHQRVEMEGLRQARWRYWRDVLSLMRPFIIRRQPAEYPDPLFTDMLRNYIKIAWRNLTKNKGYSAINIGGLAVGMAVAMLNGLWIWDELSFNNYHQNYDRIAQVVKQQIHEGETGVGQTMVYPLGTELKTKYRDTFRHLVRASFQQDKILAAGDNKLSVTGQFMDPEAPEMLSLKMIYGNRAGLNDPNAILISAQTARALFGDADPLNKVITLNNQTQVKVTGVYEDLPLNTEFHKTRFLTTWALFLQENDWIEKRAIDNWRNHFIKIYAEIPAGSTFDQVSERIKNAELNNIAHLPEESARKPQILLYPMSRWHLFPYERGQINKGPVQMVWLVGIIGGFVLLLACINFMNLSTARSEKRAKEVGIRKTVGSVRGQLISQFFSESFLVAMLALVVALFLTTVSLNWFNNLVAKQIVMPWNNGWFWATSTAFVFITGLLAGSYPALYLSSFQPVKVLKGTFRVGRFAAVPRRVLVVVQFTVSVTLIISTIIVYRQIQYAKQRPVGYSREGLITMPMKSDDFYGKYDVLRRELKNTGVVAEMSQSMGPVTDVYSGNNGFEWKGKDPRKDESFGTLAVTHEHGKTVGWQFVAGRDFSRKYASDSLGMVINEAAARYMGLANPAADAAVGELVTWRWWENNKPPIQYRILGVIKDMVMESPYEPIIPTVFYIKGHNGSVSWINIKIRPEVTASDALFKIEAVFKKLIPSAPFEYKFVDQEYAAKFAAEERIGTLAGFFASLAVLISCLGLFGLASFTAEQRTKEIGIRKILGASVASLWQMLSKDFVVLVIVACLIAIPTAFYSMSGWLQNYTYRTELSWWIFALAGAGALLITLLTVSFQAIKAALMNPVKSLRSE